MIKNIHALPPFPRGAQKSLEDVASSHGSGLCQDSDHTSGRSCVNELNAVHSNESVYRERELATREAAA